MSLTLGKGMVGGIYAAPALVIGDLTLTGYYKAWGGSAPWNSSASAGSSGSRSLNAGTVPGSSTLNSLAIATYNGSTQYSMDSGVNMGSYFGTAAYTLKVVCRAFSASAPDASVFNDECIIGEQGAVCGLTWTTSGVRWYHYDGTRRVTPFVSLAANTWCIIDVRYDGTTCEMRVNEGTWQPISGGAVGNISSWAGVLLQLGRGYGVSSFAQCDIAEVLTWGTAETDANLNAAGATLRTKYAI